MQDLRWAVRSPCARVRDSLHSRTVHAHARHRGDDSCVHSARHRAAPTPALPRRESAGLHPREVGETIADPPIVSQLRQLARRRPLLRRRRLGDVSICADSVAECECDRRGARAPSMGVSRAFFEVLGVRPIIGREFTASENALGGARAAMVSYEFWQAQMGGRLPLGVIRYDATRRRRLSACCPRAFASVYASDVYFPHEQGPGTVRSAHNYLSRRPTQAKRLALRRARQRHDCVVQISARDIRE